MQEALEATESRLREEYRILGVELHERARRKWAALQAQRFGHGGQGIVHRATGLSYPTIRRGLQEIARGEAVDTGRIRKAGGGRKRVTQRYPEILDALEGVVESSTRGDPEQVLKWTSKSIAHLHGALQAQGYVISPKSVYNLLLELGYTLQANRKVEEGGTHPDRDAQFTFINDKAKAFQKQNQPVISVDTKKKELVGNYKNPGREYHQRAQAPKVKVYDFPDKEQGKVAPYGVYDLDKNTGWVSVGISGDTGEFAVNSIRSWWQEMGRHEYADAPALYINADGGGSNGTKNRLWKKELQQLATDLNKAIHVSHFPPGTSKWNKIEHRMFCFISQNWRGRPLVDHATIVNLIGNTKTKTGLVIQATLDDRTYQKGIKVSDAELKQLNLQKESFHGEWNYIIQPK
jgi:hypothetical protein